MGLSLGLPCAVRARSPVLSPCRCFVSEQSPPQPPTPSDGSGLGFRDLGLIVQGSQLQTERLNVFRVIHKEGHEQRGS
jgi:hypothetical protein